MFEFESPVVAISNELVLCKDGSLWAKNGYEEFEEIARTKKEEKPVKKHGIPFVKSKYSEGFEVFWQKWSSTIKQPCFSKQDTYKYWLKLSPQECMEALTSIQAYGRTNSNPHYLKRANTYLKERMWESLQSFIVKQPKEKAMPDMNVNLKGVF
jgi:hypothetical protein